MYEGILVVGISSHGFLSGSVSINRKLEYDFYPHLEKALGRLQYWSDKCKFEREGELTARKNLEPELIRLWNLDEEELRQASNNAFGNGFDLDFRIAAHKWLSKYHSDYRWIIYTY